MPDISLSDDIEKRLEYISKFENVKKSEIIMKALKKYFDKL